MLADQPRSYAFSDNPFTIHVSIIPFEFRDGPDISKN